MTCNASTKMNWVHGVMLSRPLMARGFHSKNATFSIRNFDNGAFLCRKHLYQKDRADIIEEELYQGTSKGAEGYAAHLTFKRCSK